MICHKCNNEFPASVVIDDKRRSLSSRKFCFQCSPFGKHNTKKLDKSICIYRCGNCRVELNSTNAYKTKNKKSYSYCKKCFDKYTTKRCIDHKIKAIKLFNAEL